MSKARGRGLWTPCRVSCASLYKPQTTRRNTMTRWRCCSEPRNYGTQQRVLRQSMPQVKARNTHTRWRHRLARRKIRGPMRCLVEEDDGCKPTLSRHCFASNGYAIPWFCSDPALSALEAPPQVFLTKAPYFHMERVPKRDNVRYLKETRVTIIAGHTTGRS